jgi:hypothetical protein
MQCVIVWQTIVRQRFELVEPPPHHCHHNLELAVWTPLLCVSIKAGIAEKLNPITLTDGDRR